jgi:HD-like signal output (HDOD) protein
MAFFFEELTTMLLKGEDLPTLPDVVFQLHGALDDELVGDARIADIVERDPAIAAKLLRISNSALLSCGVEVTTVLSAVKRLGIRQIRSLCLVVSVVKSFHYSQSAFDHRHFWEHSAAVGRLAQTLGRHIPTKGAVDYDDLYVAGLLHDVGLLMLDQFFHQHFKEILEVRALSGDPLWKCEDLVIGMDHGEVGGLLLGRWSLPKSTVKCVSSHHSASIDDDEYRNACAIVRAAEVICNCHGVGLEFEESTEEDVFVALEPLELSESAVESVLDEATQLRNSPNSSLVGA